MSDNDNEDCEDLTRPILPSISASQPYATLDGDLEDAISGKSPHRPISLEVRSLSTSLQHYTGHCLTDCLCWIQKVSCFNLSAPALLSARGNIVHDSDLGEPCLRVGNPVATLVQHHRTKASPPMEILWPLLQSAVDSRRLEITYIENSFLNTRPNYI